jgi:hypothetical protein
VRENRTPGSVRGLSGNWQSYRDGGSHISPTRHKALVQVEKGEINVSELIQNQITGDTDKGTVEEPEDKDTYHEFERVVRIASAARVLSWISLGIGVLLLVLNVLSFVDAMSTIASTPSYTGTGFTVTFSLAWPAFVNSISPLLNSGFFFVVMQAVSEGIFILLDIEDNTRRTANDAHKRSE